MAGFIECVAMYKYEAKLEDELTLMVGDIVRCVQKREGGWWHGKLRDREGVFPENFVHTVDALDDNILLRTRGQKYRINFHYKPVRVDELELIPGQLVEVVGVEETGWWKGRSRDRLGVFPSSFVSGPINEQDLFHHAIISPPSPQLPPVADPRSFMHRVDICSSPVVLRRHSLTVMNIPISSNLFDPEDEPFCPMFGSPSLFSYLEKDSSTSSLSSCSNSKSSMVSKIRDSFCGKTLLPRLRRRRLSSGSLFDTHSTCSPIMPRRNSVSAFFKRSSPSILSSKLSRKLNRTSLSWDMIPELPGLKPITSTPVPKLEGVIRKASLSSESKRSEQSLSWVWQEGEKKTPDRTNTPSNCRRPCTSSGDSGVDGCDGNYDFPEELFGPVDITDEVFEDMFSSQHSSSIVGPRNLFEEKSTISGEAKVRRSKMITSFSNIKDVKKVKLRNSIPTNPFVSWRANENLLKLSNVQVTEL